MTSLVERAKGPQASNNSLEAAAYAPITNMRHYSIVIALSGLWAACAGTAKPLPHSLYYLDRPGEEAQVWRLEADGETSTQVTHEESEV